MVAQYVTIARRKGATWYVGSLNNNTARTISLPLDFLSARRYTAEIYRVASDVGEHPNHLVKQTKIVSKNDTLTIQLATGGGQAMKLVRKQ